MSARTYLVGCMLTLLAVSNAAAVIMLDAGPGPAQAGWLKIDKYNDYAHAPGGSYLGELELGSGVTAGFANSFNTSSTDRGATAIANSSLHALGLDELFRDYCGFSNAGGGAYTLFVRGLPAGDYNVTIYSADPSYPGETRAVAVQGTTVLFDPYGSSPTLDMVAKTITVTVDGTGEMAITRPVGQSAPCKFNGLIIAAVPEPATLLVLLAGVGLAVIRRR